MNRVILLLSLVFLMRCEFPWQKEVDELKAKTVETYSDTKDKAIEVKDDLVDVKESIETKVDEINTAIDEINEAKDAVDKALGTGGDDEAEAN